jgi:hypothetical protein
MRRWITSGGLLATACGTPILARAAESAAANADKLKGFGLANADAGSLPVGRIIATFLMVAALAWAATWVLRRYGFRGAAVAAGAAATIRPLARNTLPGGVTCHLIETQGRQVLITVTRHGVTSVVLGEAPVTAVVTP